MVAEKLEKFAGDLKGKTIGILGLAFKPETDDVREAPALTIIADLIERGASIRAYDPQAMEEAKKALRKYADNITYCKHAYDTAESVDALVIVTEWHEFRNMDLTLLKKIMRGNIFYDARNIYSRKDIEEKGFVFIGTGV